MGAIIEFFSLFASSTFLRQFLSRALVQLGISTVTYAGVSAGVSAIASSVGSNFAGLPASTLAIMSLMHIPQALNVIWSALVGSLAVRGLTSSGILRKVVWKPGQTGDLFS